MANTIDLRGLVRPQLVEATKREDNPNVAEFRLQPLERGFGHTLGNAMRRMLLSSLRGAAVWGFRIDGVVHEHQTIPGVVEDVHQIIGNLKTLTLTLADDVEETVLRISKSEAGPVTAADIVASSGARIVDPTHHLFTLQDDRDINVDLYVNKGRGYVESDQHPIDRGLPVDLVRIDSIYNPVRRANFTVAETRVGQRTDYDRLVAHGRDQRHDLAGRSGELRGRAGADALPVLRRLRFAFVGAAGADERVDGRRRRAPRQLLRTPIDDLELSVRSVNSLKNSNIRTLGDLVRQTESQILQVKNFGKKSLQEIADLLEREGSEFRDAVRGERRGRARSRLGNAGEPRRRRRA